MKEDLIKSKNSNKNNLKKENNPKNENNSKEGFAKDTYNSMEDFWFSIYMAGENNETQQRGLLETLGINIKGEIISIDTKMPPDIEPSNPNSFSDLVTGENVKVNPNIHFADNEFINKYSQIVINFQKAYDLTLYEVGQVYNKNGKFIREYTQYNPNEIKFPKDLYKFGCVPIIFVQL